jgi:antitoxin component of MazEF toxin-antitoxin module
MPVIEDSRKVQSFGSSLAITLPSFFVKAAGVEKGSEVMVVYGLDGVLIVAKVDDPSTVEKGLYAILDEFERRRLQRHRK